MRLLLEKVYIIIKNFLKKLLGKPQYLLENNEDIKPENTKLIEKDETENNENKNSEKEMILKIYKQINDNKIDLKTLPMPILLKVMILSNEQNKLYTQIIEQKQEALRTLDMQLENSNEETEKIKRKIQ